MSRAQPRRPLARGGSAASEGAKFWPRTASFPDRDAPMKLLYLGLRNISSERGGFSGTGTYNWTVVKE